jgi:hypothetical protein
MNLTDIDYVARNRAMKEYFSENELKLIHMSLSRQINLCAEFIKGAKSNSELEVIWQQRMADLNVIRDSFAK